MVLSTIWQVFSEFLMLCDLFRELMSKITAKNEERGKRLHGAALR